MSAAVGYLMMNKAITLIGAFAGVCVACTAGASEMDRVNVRQMLPPDQRDVRWITPAVANDCGVVWQTRRYDPNWKGPGSQYIDRYYLQPSNSNVLRWIHYASKRWADRLVWCSPDGSVVFGRHGVEPWTLLAFTPSGTITTQSLYDVRLGQADADPYPVGACRDGVFLQPYALNTSQPIFLVPWSHTNAIVDLSKAKRISTAEIRVSDARVISSGDIVVLTEVYGGRLMPVYCYDLRRQRTTSLDKSKFWPTGIVDGDTIVGHSWAPEGIVAVHLPSHAQEFTETTDVIQMDWDDSIQDGSNLLVRIHGTDDYARLCLQNMIDHRENDWLNALRRKPVNDVRVKTEP